MSIAKRLSKYADVTLYEYGRSFPKSICQLKYYSKCLQEHLDKNVYDIILTHSTGGRILLDTTYFSRYTILANTAYNGVMLLLPILPILPIMLGVVKIMPKRAIYNIAKQIAGITMGDNNLFDDIMYEDVRTASIISTILSALELSIDSFSCHSKINSRVIIVHGEQDKVVPMRNTLKLAKDLGVNKITTLKSIGHTSILECEDYYVDLIKKLGEECVRCS